MSAETPRTVLIALADVTVAHAFARILEMRGHHAFVATHFAEAVESAPFDVLIVEFGAGARGSGLGADELVGTLRGLGHDPITLAVANAPTDRDLQTMLDLDVDDILDRPVMPERIVEAVEESRFRPSRDEHPAEPSRDSAELVIDLVPHRDAAESAAREVVAWSLRCDIVPGTRARIGSAVAEAVENAVAAGSSRIEVHALVTRTELTVAISDDGCGFDVVDALTEDGLDCSTGLGRMHSLAEAVTLDSTPGNGAVCTLTFRVTTTEFEEEDRIDLSDLDFFVAATSKELLATLAEDPNAPIVLSPALAVVVGRLLMGPRPTSLLEGALRA